MDAKIGDRVAIDGKKIGQTVRAGVVREVTVGLAGTRYMVEWDDGHSSSFAPSAGTLVVVGRGTAKAKAKAKPKAKPKPAAKAKAKAKAKPPAKAKAKPSKARKR